MQKLYQNNIFSPHRTETELEADMAELHASLMASPSRSCHTAPKPVRKTMSQRRVMPAATSTSLLNTDSVSPASSKLRSSWVRLPGGGWEKKPSEAVERLLAATGVLLVICGLAAGAMCFYLLSQVKFTLKSVIPRQRGNANPNLENNTRATYNYIYL